MPEATVTAAQGTSILGKVSVSSQPCIITPDVFPITAQRLCGRLIWVYVARSQSLLRCRWHAWRL